MGVDRGATARSRAEELPLSSSERDADVSLDSPRPAIVIQASDTYPCNLLPRRRCMSQDIIHVPLFDFIKINIHFFML